MQTANKILMVRPAKFAYNEQTAESNHFQGKLCISNINEKALVEFDNFVNILRNNKIDVVVVQDTKEPHTPDSIFPNNWFSTHSTGELILYPMFAENRRLERKPAVLNTISQYFNADKIIDLTEWEKENKFLEGTGSIILDHINMIAYACRSDRTDESVFEEFCSKMKFKPVFFDAVDENGNSIYHTNVMMSIGEKVAVICSEAISEKSKREIVLKSLIETKKEIVEISFNQMNHFCANILEVRNSKNSRCLIMSQTSCESFTESQKEVLNKYSKIISAPLQTIESIGGGSARCMIAEIF